VEPFGQYEVRYNLRFVDALGNGKDGRVFKTADGQAVKFFNDETIYRRELRAYQILRQRDIDGIKGFQIPQLTRWDDALLAIEMTVVQPPFLLDFASAYTQNEYDRSEFTQEVLDERQTHWSDIFADDWPTVQLTSQAFTQQTGLILLDLSLNNIRFKIE
jgi:hypothetical protein